MKTSRARRWTRTAFDAVLFLTVLAVLLVTLLGYITPSHTVVSCDDPSIRRSIGKETVPISMLFSISFILPFLMMAVVEWALPPSNLAHDSSPLCCGLKRSWRYLTDLFVGCLFMYFLTDLTKTTVGEARPIFWEICRPNLTTEQCQEKYVSVTWRDCTNPFNVSHYKLVESMKSFPSGHASISVYSCVFMVVYIHKRLWRVCSLLISPWLQLLWVTWALICCQSRIWDNRHFWWDVLGGAVLGAVMAYLTLNYLSNWFERAGDFPPIIGSSGKEGDEPPSPPSTSTSYHLPEEEEEDRSSRFSRTSIKRLISTPCDAEGQRSGAGGDRELRDISSTP